MPGRSSYPGSGPAPTCSGALMVDASMWQLAPKGLSVGGRPSLPRRVTVRYVLPACSNCSCWAGCRLIVLATTTAAAPGVGSATEASCGFPATCAVPTALPPKLLPPSNFCGPATCTDRLPCTQLRTEDIADDSRSSILLGWRR
jgi:hypothetical protein